MKTFGKVILPVMLSILPLTKCMEISRVRQPVQVENVVETPLDKMQMELASVAEVVRTGNGELIVRFPEVALFDIGESALRAGAERSLANVAAVLSNFPAYAVIVEGHSDCTGPESYNQWLSEMRSRVVAEFLVNAGLDPNRIQVIGYGESRPLVRGGTPEELQRNRRVELHILPMKP